MNLCEAEKMYILHGIEENLRIDGREREEYRPMELETGLVSHAYGSARFRLANTDILTAVKIEVDSPFPERPHDGKLEFFVDCSANATPDFEGRGGDQLAVQISNLLHSAYRSSNALDLTRLCILSGKKCWKLYVDILILECGGNLYDAVSIAVKAALWNTQIPLIKSIDVDGNKVELSVSDDVTDCERLDVTKAPILVTVCKIGDRCVIDPSDAEEQCSKASVMVARSGDRLTSSLKLGTGSLHPKTLIDCLAFGYRVAEKMNEALDEVLKRMPLEQDVGFLK